MLELLAYATQAKATVKALENDGERDREAPYRETRTKNGVPSALSKLFLITISNIFSLCLIAPPPPFSLHYLSLSYSRRAHIFPRPFVLLSSSLFSVSRYLFKSLQSRRMQAEGSSILTMEDSRMSVCAATHPFGDDSCMALMPEELADWRGAEISE